MSATFGGYTGGALPTPRGPSGGGGGGNSSRNGRGGRGSRGRNRDRDRDNRRNRNHNRRRSSGGRSWSRSRSRSRSRDREDSDDQEERERKWTREGSRSHRKNNKTGRQPQQREPIPSVEGWIVMITNVHKEAQEDDVREMFGEFGEIQNCHLNLDRKTGYCKGYALLEYEKKSSADEAIEKCHKKGELLGQTIGVEFAFVAPPGGGGYGGRGHGGGGRGGRGGHRRRY